MQKFITICTPTYNRAYMLPKLYESLANQSNKKFIWLIVDDGSSDETENLIRNFQLENKIEIQYIFQENRGKHFAVNNGLRNSETAFFCVIDSDDFLAIDAVFEMELLSEKIKNNDQIAGFTFIRFSEKTDFDKNKYGEKEWIVSGSAEYDWEFPGEMIYCFKTEIHQQFYFPEFAGEKFCPESLVFRRIERRFKILFTDKVLAFGDYLEDGLTSNYYQLLLRNPKSSLLNIREKFQDKLTSDQKMDFAKTYWDIASKSNVSFKDKFFGISPILILKVLINKFKK